MKRGAITKRNSRLVNLWVPIGFLPALDQAVRKLDTDRSKFIRVAMKEKLEKNGICVGEEVA